MLKIDELKKADKNIPGFNVMLMGPAGTGKTYSLGTLVETGVDVFYLGMEPGLESLLGYFVDRGKEIPSNLHWHFVAAPAASFSELIQAAEKVNTMNLETLAKSQDLNRNKHNQSILMLKALANFTCQRTGESFGPVDDWDVSRVLVIDGLSGVCNAAMNLVIGTKPVKSQSDWGVAQGQVLSHMRMLTQNCRCHFVLIAHVEREVDEVMGGIKLMVSALGKALRPLLPPLFSDVVLAVREGTKWGWDTVSSSADIKTRNLPWVSNNLPSFKPLIETWVRRMVPAAYEKD